MDVGEIRRFTVPGKPEGKGRPRFARRGKYVVAYTDSKTENYEAWVAECYLTANPNEKPLLRAVRVEIVGYWPLSKSDYWPVNKKHHGELRQSGWDKLSGKILPTCKVDADNLGKVVLDALNHCGAWKDDAQVADFRVLKKFSEDPRVEVTISEIT